VQREPTEISGSGLLRRLPRHGDSVARMKNGHCADILNVFAVDTVITVNQHFDELSCFE
jgi:hypothetical protein